MKPEEMFQSLFNLEIVFKCPYFERCHFGSIKKLIGIGQVCFVFCCG